MTERLIHEILPVGLLQCNCSVLGDRQTREAIVLDPGDEVDRILEILARHQLSVRAIISTHTHIDHVGGLAGLHQATQAPVLIHKEDFDLYRHLDFQARWLGVPTPPTTTVDSFLREGDAVRWGEFEASILYTPGHTPGSISLYLSSDGGTKNGKPHGDTGVSTAPRLFAGDTLFAGSIGRTDLWGGSYPKIIQSIHDKFLILPDQTIVYPGHGPTTTIGAERDSNPFLLRG